MIDIVTVARVDSEILRSARQLGFVQAKHRFSDEVLEIKAVQKDLSELRKMEKSERVSQLIKTLEEFLAETDSYTCEGERSV